MSRNFMATHNMIAVSANNQETAINTEQTLDTTMLFSLDSMLDREPRREDNSDEATGYEEPDSVYSLGDKSMGTLKSDKAQPQHFAFLLAYALGSAAAAAAGTGYQHTITPIDGDLDFSRSNPSFTAAQRFGKTVLKRRFASMFVDSVTCTFTKDDWCKITASIMGTGKKTDNVVTEDVSAVDNATSLTLAANAIEGATAAERLANVQEVRAELTAGVWTDITPTAASDATPAVITIPSQGGAGASKTYRITYIAAESGWMSFPSRVTETPLRIAQMTFKAGGTWNGSAFQGGREMNSEIKSIEYSLNNNGAVEFVPGAGDAYANRYVRGGRVQALKLNREARDYNMQQRIDDSEYFGVYILCEGVVYDDPHKYQVEFIFPRVAILAAPWTVDGKRLAEAGDMRVLEDETYGSVIVKVKNLEETYAA